MIRVYFCNDSRGGEDTTTFGWEIDRETLDSWINGTGSYPFNTDDEDDE